MKLPKSLFKTLLATWMMAGLTVAPLADAKSKNLTVSDVYVDDIDTDDLEQAAKKALDRHKKSSTSTQEFKNLIQKKENLPYLIANSREDVIFDRIRELGAEGFTTLCDPPEESTISSCMDAIFHEISDRHSLTTTSLAIGSTLATLYATEFKNKVKKSTLNEEEKQKKLDHLDLEIVKTQLIIVRTIIKQEPKMIVVTRPDTAKIENELREKIKNQLIRFILAKTKESKAVARSSIPKELEELTGNKN